MRTAIKHLHPLSMIFAQLAWTKPKKIEPGEKSRLPGLIDEFRIVLGGQPTPSFFFSQQNSRKACFYPAGRSSFPKSLTKPQGETLGKKDLLQWQKNSTLSEGHTRYWDCVKHVWWGRREVRFNLFGAQYSKLLVPTCFAIPGYPWQWVETKWRWLATHDHVKLVYRRVSWS